MPSHCTTCQYVECFLFHLLLMPLVELLVHGFATLPGGKKVGWAEAKLEWTGKQIVIT